MGRLVFGEEAGGEGELYGVDGELLRFFLVLFGALGHFLVWSGADG